MYRGRLNPREVVGEVVSKYGCDRGRLVQILQEIQKTFRYLPRESLEEVSEKLGVSLSEVLNVATFYHQFRLEPVGRYIIYVCFGTACYLRGASEVYEAIRRSAGLSNGRSTTEDGLLTVEKARCFGCCSLAPVAMVLSSDGSERYVHGKLTPQAGRRLVFNYRSKARE
ncbi:MAG: NAD(P)H-dependent oxidoreductase subunit E [Sulfolobales archaeon]|nr:NAD(P)H-dependent oxidoreductase subunit E [Sulfolobales archaeon]MDW8082331.1 NAD(P)H-dependent oxidoreductase subunit E [Sulfolobales archaeon]